MDGNLGGSQIPRRTILTSSVGLATAGLAGCLGGNDPTDGGPSDEQSDDGNPAQGGEEGAITAVNGSFFMLYDFARNVAGEQLDVRDLVPVGAHGDDWEPDPGIVDRIAEADVFVYIEGFRRWSDDVARTLPQDFPDVIVIDAAEGIEYITGQEGREEDPHFWMDPRKATEAVENIRDGFAEADPAHADIYTENAEHFMDRLDEIHGEFEYVAENRTKDMIVIGSHDSFQYWTHRYGFEIYSPVGIDPDAEPTAQEMDRVRQIVDAHDLEYILYDMYEPTTLADALASETDTEILPLSPIEATTEEQLEQGMGYVEHQLDINIDTLHRALAVKS